MQCTSISHRQLRTQIVDVPMKEACTIVSHVLQPPVLTRTVVVMAAIDPFPGGGGNISLERTKTLQTLTSLPDKIVIRGCIKASVGRRVLQPAHGNSKPFLYYIVGLMSRDNLKVESSLPAWETRNHS